MRGIFSSYSNICKHAATYVMFHKHCIYVQFAFLSSLCLNFYIEFFSSCIVVAIGFLALIEKFSGALQERSTSDFYFYQKSQTPGCSIMRQRRVRHEKVTTATEKNDSASMTVSAISTFSKYLHCLCAMFVETKICEKVTYLTIGLPSVQRKSLSNILSFRPIHW